MTLVVLAVGLLLNALWLWRAERACRLGGHRALRAGVVLFALYQIAVWCVIDPTSTARASSSATTLALSALVWTGAIVPLSLAGEGVAVLRRRVARADR